MRPPIKLQVPNSSGVKLLVTIKVKINPVTIVENPITKEIKPEYVTLILDNYFDSHLSEFVNFLR